MKITVLLATYNGEKYIEEQLESLLYQTRQLDELIVVDDKSNDSTVSLIRQFVFKNNIEDKCKIFVNEYNKGWRENFIEGISRTTGDIIFFCDQDDIWYQNKIEVFCNIFENNQEFNVVCSKETLWDGVKAINTTIENESYRIPILNGNGKDLWIQSPGCAMAVRREYLKKILLYYCNGWGHDDFVWKFAILDRCLCFLNNSSILHRVHGNNESMKKRDFLSTVEEVKLSIRVCNSMMKYCNENIIEHKDAIKILKHKLKGNIVRLEFLETKKKKNIFQLIVRYNDLYRRKRQIVGDYLLIHGFRS